MNNEEQDFENLVNDLISTKEVAKILKVSVAMVRNLTLRNELPGIRIGALYRYKKKDIQRILIEGVGKHSENFENNGEKI